LSALAASGDGNNGKKAQASSGFLTTIGLGVGRSKYRLIGVLTPLINR